MFSYVAKSLLSKTLRAFLSKYLENIELESIDYGRSSSSSSSVSVGGGIDSGGTSHSSGWGVRLSNVKLREGMELVKLPGKRKRRTRKKVKRKDNKDKKKKKSSVYVDNNSINDLTPRTENKKRLVQLEGTSESFPMQQEKVPLHYESNIHDNCRDRLWSAEEEYTEDGYFSSAPSTPNQGNGICGVPSNFCLHGNRSRSPAAPLLDDEHNKYSVGNGDSNDNTPNVNGEHITSMEEEESEPSSLSTPSDQDDSSSDDDDSYVEVEEEVVVEDAMALVVGAGGAIGTLNIRLVGKELHITVEDAHLVVEALPNEEDGNETKNRPKPDTVVTPLSSEPDIPPSEKESVPTIGEKVKKKSLMARYLSMIPHLFLRDCRVSLILPEEIGNDESTDESIEDCTIFEIGIDFLSVTSGDALLDTLRFDTGNSQRTPIKSKTRRRRSSMASETPSSNSEQDLGKSKTAQSNIFARKRIRTGKGPDAGIWLKVQPPLGKIIQLPHRSRHPNELKCARRRFLESSESFLFRVSGLDLHARMLTHRKDEVDLGNTWSNEYEDYTMDSMLFGVDYVDPVSLTRHSIKKNLSENDIDGNGIESLPYASNFHWIAQRQHRSNCNNSHLPLKECFDCWNACCVQEKTASSKTSMDNIMPVPGFVFCFTTTDPVEVNIDRNSLDAIGYLQSLVTSPKKEQTKKEKEDGGIEDGNIHDNSNAVKAKTGSVKKNAPPCVFDDKSFPSFMQPECVYLSSIHVSKLVIRVEALQSEICPSTKFRFWELVGHQLQYEEKQVDSDEQFSRDILIHVGSIECQDYVGVCVKNLIAAGVVDPPYCSDDKVHLPGTAARILGVPYPTSNEKSFAANARIIKSDFPKEENTSASIASRVGFVQLKLGIVDIDLDNTLLSDMSKVSGDVKSIVFNAPKKLKEKPVTKTKEFSKQGLNVLFQVLTVGGSLSYKPKIRMKIPDSKFRMRKGPEGFSFNAFLDQLGIEYGSYTFEQPKQPSLLPLCLLSESLRMHILLYLDDDLSSLEHVLNIKKKKKTSAFLRGHAVNKKLGQLPMKKLQCRHTEDRRKNAINQLQALDIDALEALLRSHNI